MARIVVNLQRAQARGLPPVSVKSGKSADGYAPAGPKGKKVLLPLTQAEFDRVKYLRGRQKSAVFGGVACLAGGVALSRFPVLLPLGIVIAILSAAMWGLAALVLKGYLPGVELDEERGRVELTRVHRRFVAAVTDSAS